MGIPHLLAHEPEDNVAVVVIEGLTAGTQMSGVITANNSDFTIEARHDIPIGHKVALVDVKKGDAAIKYGEDIGVFVADVARGEHVHIHNLKTKRW